MSDDKKNGEQKKVTPSHPQVRYMQAQELAGKAVHSKNLEELTDYFEKSLQMGEQAGLRAAKSFFETRVAVLRQSFANGVANHILQATNKFVEWVNRSENFKLWVRPEVVTPETVNAEEKEAKCKTCLDTKKVKGTDNIIDCPDCSPKVPGSDRKFFGKLESVPTPEEEKGQL